MPLIHSWRGFICAVLCGAIISASSYALPPFDAQVSARVAAHRWLWPIAVIAGLVVVPRLFAVRLIEEALRLPGWLGGAFWLLYWPFLGAVVGRSKHWILWAVVVLAINIGLLAWLLYALKRAKFTF